MFKIIEAYKDEDAVENEEEAVDMDMDEVGDSMMTVARTSKNEKAQQEVMGEATQDRGMTIHMLNVTITKSLVITFPNVEHLAIRELKRRPPTLKKEVKKMEPCWSLLM